jgi:hypothetical protein
MLMCAPLRSLPYKAVFPDSPKMGNRLSQMGKAKRYSMGAVTVRERFAFERVRWLAERYKLRQSLTELGQI